MQKEKDYIRINWVPKKKGPRSQLPLPNDFFLNDDQMRGPAVPVG